MNNSMQQARAALALTPKCGAHCRRTGLPCKNAQMPNGRCRMHGGKSTGRPIVTGAHTKAAKATRKQARQAIAEGRALIGEIMQSLGNEG